MYLSHQTIEKYIDAGKIVIKPSFDKKDLRPVGIRIHLAKDILIPLPGQTVDLTSAQDIKYKEVDITKEEFYIEPGDFILGATYELIQTPKNIIAFVGGKSTVARLGLTTNITASVVDGVIGDEPVATVLEIKNVGNFRVRLKFMDPIDMVVFAELTESVEQEIGRRYDGQIKVTPPNILG
ncbi:MAG: dCTP deaminase [Candidatus Vogelbacteria bacterium]|nr:dCTP deaminase [Candidatus Vogelbacteria bacterium]